MNEKTENAIPISKFLTKGVEFVKDYEEEGHGSYSYTAFGLHFESDLLLPELKKRKNSITADVRILLGKVPESIDRPLESNPYFQASPNQFLLHLDGIADFFITDGKQILIQSCNGAEPRKIRLYLLGTAMGVLLMQRGIVPIHGSTAVIHGNGVVFTGVSGAGKSTMAAALWKRGYSILADDVSAVDFNEEKHPWVIPGYAQQKLWQTSAALVGIDTDSLDRIYQEIPKYAVPVRSGFGKKPIPIRAIYEIDVRPCPDVEIISVKGKEKLITIIKNIYRFEFSSGLGMREEYFRKCADLAACVEVFRLIRPQHVVSLNRQVDVLLEHYSGLCTEGLKVAKTFKGGRAIGGCGSKT